MKAADALREAAARLGAVSDTARLDAELLMAHAAGMTREALILGLRDMETPESFAALVERRLAYEPISHIIGARDFWTLTLKVTPDVLTPRPDSETLIEAAIDYFRDRSPPRRVLDLGTGSGALLLAALDKWREASGVGIDISEKALEVARENAARFGMTSRATFRLGDWLDSIDGQFDLILANPPYIKSSAILPRDVEEHEPHLALFAGHDGLDAYRAIAPALEGALAAGGVALFEIGYDQGESGAALFKEAGLNIALRADLAGHSRCLIATLRA